MKAAAAEQLRQERETFELNKRQAAQWFGLRLRMGYCGLAMLVLMAAVCAAIILTAAARSPWVIKWATFVLAGDILALLITVWRMVLAPASAIKLAPVTRDNSPNGDWLHPADLPCSVAEERAQGRVVDCRVDNEQR